MRSSKRWWLAVATCALAVPAFASDAPLRLQQEEMPVGGEAEETEAGEQVVIETDEVEVQTDEGDQARDRGGKDSGLYALIGGGVEGYTGDLGDRLKTSPSAGLAVGLKAPLIGIEASYNAGGIETETELDSGLDVVRHSGQLAATLQMTDTALQPFILAGGGYDWFNVQETEAADPSGQGAFEDAGNFYVPAGVGVRYQAGKLITVDVRGTYNFLLDEDFIQGVTTGDRIQGLATVGGTF
jgi:hypothetical protein